MMERWRGLAGPSVALFAILSSAIGIVNQYTYDDRYIIQLEPSTHTLHRWWQVFASSYWPKNAGGDGYRPITILAFKIQWVIGHGNPAVFHAVNILLYAAVSVLVFVLARRLLPLWAAWLVGASFAVHPVHVEAVANVVGQSEMLVALAVIAATILYVNDRLREGGGAAGALRPSTIVWIVLLYAFGCLSKEHGIVLPGILLAAELTVIDDRSSLRDRIVRLRPFYLGMAAVAVAFLAARSFVLSGRPLGGFEPFLPFSALRISSTDRALTALGVVPQWIRLLYWPVRLSSDYGPPEIDIAQGVSIVQLPGLLLLVGILALGVLLRRRQPAIAFGIAIVCVALLPSSNFILPAGIVLAERTLFLPSVGAMLVIGGTALVIADRLRASPQPARATATARAVCAAALVAGTVRSATRTRVWRDNDTLFAHAVLDAPDSYRTHYVLGSWYLDQKKKRLAEAEYRKGLKLFPYDPYLAFGLAEEYRTSGICGAALPLYHWAREVDPEFPIGRTQYALCLFDAGAYDSAKYYALEAVRAGGLLPALHELIHDIDSARVASRKIDQGGKLSMVALAASRGKLPDTVQKSTPKSTSAPPR